MRYHLQALFGVTLAILMGSTAAGQSADLSQVMIDVSSHNNLMSIIPHLRERKIELIVVRATIGLDSPDTTFDQKVRMLRMQSPDTFKGAYHALYPTSPGKDQARDFLKTIKKSCLPGEKYILAVDWERPVLKGKQTDPAPAETVEDFIKEVEADTGRKPMVYTGPDIIQGQKSTIGTLTSAAPLWLSTYYSKLYLARGCKKPSTLQDGYSCKNSIHGLIFPDESDYAPWTAWSFWQFSAASKDDPAFIRHGVSKNLPVDVSFYGGGREDFHSFYSDNAVACDDILI